MIKKYLPLLFVIFFTISFISAIDIRFTGEQNTELDVYETCSFNNLPCGSGFLCNISIQDPQSNILVLNQPMTRNDTVYNYTLSTTQTNSLGIYEVTQVYCTDGSNNGTSSFYFRITPNGAEPIDTGGGLTILGTFLILILAIIFFLTFGIFTKNKPFKIFFVSISVLMMVATVGFAASTLQQVLSTFQTLVTAYGRFYILMTTLIIGGAVGLIVYLIVTALKNLDSTRHFFKGGKDDDYD